MCREGGKAPYAPWADSDAPVECNHSDHDTPMTCAECDHHAGYKWGSEGNRRYVHADYDTAREWAAKVPTLSSDLVFIQREADPFAFVDGDDVRDPGTGEVHPAFRAILEANGCDDRPGPSTETDFDLSDHEPAATDRGETTDDIRDIYAKGGHPSDSALSRHHNDYQ